MPMNDNENKVIDLNLGSATKTQIRIDGRNDSILELDLSDMGIAERLENGYTQLKSIIQEIVDYEGESTGAYLKEQDKKMRATMDYIFDANVSETCCPFGTMFDLQDGEYKFERILNALTKLYEANLNEEYKLMKKRIENAANKYMPQDHKPKSKSVQRREKIQKGEDE